MASQDYKPDFTPHDWSQRDRHFLVPFATNADGLVSVLRNLPPEIVGALCSRASRAKGSLLEILLREYIYPIVDGGDPALADRTRGHGRVPQGTWFQANPQQSSRAEVLREVALPIRRRLDRPDDRHARHPLGRFAGCPQVHRRPARGSGADRKIDAVCQLRQQGRREVPLLHPRPRSGTTGSRPRLPCRHGWVVRDLCRTAGSASGLAAGALRRARIRPREEGLRHPARALADGDAWTGRAPGQRAIVRVPAEPGPRAIRWASFDGCPKPSRRNWTKRFPRFS